MIIYYCIAIKFYIIGAISINFVENLMICTGWFGMLPGSSPQLGSFVVSSGSAQSLITCFVCDYVFEIFVCHHWLKVSCPNIYH